MKDKYWYKVVGYEKVIDKGFAGGEALYNSTAIQVIAEDEKEAIALAKKIIKKPLYRTAEAGELNQGAVDSLELQKQQLELNKQIFELNKQTKENISALAKAIEKMAGK